MSAKFCNFAFEYKQLQKHMKNKNIVLTFCLAFLPMLLVAQNQDSIIGRPYKSFDLTAFCSYTTFHPSQYLTDNNWDIHIVVARQQIPNFKQPELAFVVLDS